MSECPYQENVIDEDTNTESVNDKYIAWHQGYEAHKCDMATWSTLLRQELEDEIRKIKQLQVELIIKYYEDKKKLISK